jgi:ferrochelatase
MKKGVLLVAHGTIDDLDDLPAFLGVIRRGPASPELVHEVRRRYQAAGGSPLNGINDAVAKKLELVLGVPVRLANRLWVPYPKEVLEQLRAHDVTHVAVVPIAQHSAHVYAQAAEEAASALGAFTLASAKNWGQSELLTRAFAERITRALSAIPRPEHARTLVLMTAHSLPVAVVRAGDAYESELRASAEAIARHAKLGEGNAAQWSVAFQSQGMSAGPGGKPMEWLGPDLRSAFDDARTRGITRVVVAPIGFLADHVEILFDIDLEAKAWAEERGLELSRTASLNSDDDLIAALAEVARPLLESLDGARPGQRA